MTMWGLRRGLPENGRRVPTAGQRALLWAAVIAVLCGVFELGQPLENLLRATRNKIRQHPASGEVVVVGIDERSLEKIGPWPWPRSRHAALVDRLNEVGARSISFDLTFSESTISREDKVFATSLARSKRPVTLAIKSELDPVTKLRSVRMPVAALREHAELANITVRYDFGGSVWTLPYAKSIGEKYYSTMAAKIAGVTRPEGGEFFVDYAIDPRSVPMVSAADVISGASGLFESVIAGKDVIVATTAPVLGDVFLLPGYGRLAGVYIQALGSETLRSGTPRDGGWVGAFFASLALAAFAVRRTRLRSSLSILGMGSAALLGLPLLFDTQLLSINVVPAMVLLLFVSAGTSWSSFRRSYRARGTVNAQSGLPNLDALRSNELTSDCVLIAARIGNYAQIAAALSADEENALVLQMAQRLTVGSAGQTLYQGDEGIFAWFTPSTDVEAVGAHLDALHGFFRESLNVADKQVDLAICFGLDTESDRSPANRLGSALVACEEAAAEGLRWKAIDPAALVDASWKLSLLGQLDRAIDSGDFWVAYQPKLDLSSGRIVGAEALARWTHPEKGAIAPIDFILAAEQSDRIERLTRFVLDRAIAAAAKINDAGYKFNIAVNLSTRLIGDPALTQLVADLLARRGLAAHHLTLEVTETAAMGTSGTNLETLAALRDLGVCISVDDYGTGLSTLEYLKKIPATEIKIDQTFVGAITRSHSDRLMVRSTIQLVHSLGHVVVAEGVEDQATIDALRAMGCDYAQGFFIGRPMTLDAIEQSLGTRRDVKRARHR